LTPAKSHAIFADMKTTAHRSFPRLYSATMHRRALTLIFPK